MTERDETKVETIDQRLARLAQEWALERIQECVDSAQLYLVAWPPLAEEFLAEAQRLRDWLKNTPTTDV